MADKKSRSRSKSTTKKAGARSKSRSTSRSRKSTTKSPRSGKKSPARSSSRSRSKKVTKTVESPVSASKSGKITVTVREELVRSSVDGRYNESFTSLTKTTDDSAKSERVRARGKLSNQSTPPILDTPVTSRVLRSEGSASSTTVTQKVTPVKSVSASKESKSSSALDVIGLLFFIVLLPTICYYVNLMCKRKKCTVSIPSMPNWQNWFDLQAYTIFDGFVIFTILSMYMPVGKLAIGRDGFRYRCNATFSCLTLVVSYGLAVYYFKIPVDRFILGNFYQLMTVTFIFSVVLSVISYVCSWGVSVDEICSESNGNVINDFVMGRAINPRIKGFDVKFYIMRLSFLFWLVLELSLLSEAIDRNNPLAVPKNLPLVLTSFCHITYIFAAASLEDTFVIKPAVKYDGMGYFGITTLVLWTPFLYTLTSRFALSAPVVSTPLLVFSMVLHVLGFLMFLGANRQQYLFRQNPYDPRFANVESISTGPDSPRLLVGGWWSLCRKPNYLGDLIMAISWSLMTGVTHVIPYFYPIFFLMLALYLPARDEQKCRDRYGRHWDVYCERVPYKLIPYVY